MTVEEKKALRDEKLKALYDFNEESAGRAANIRYTDLHSNDEDKKIHLA